MRLAAQRGRRAVPASPPRGFIVTSQAERERRNRQVLISDSDFARFRSELPGLIAYFERRLVPRRRRWALGALAYGGLTLAGLFLFDWSPVLVLTHVVLSQWIPLGAEIAALRRLQRGGMTRLVAADHVHRFVGAVARELDVGRRQWDRADGPRMLDRDRLDSDVPADSTDKTSPGALASVLLFLGLIGTTLLAGALLYVDAAQRDAMLSDPWALAVLAATSAHQCFAEYRAKLTPPMPGATWNIEFHAGLRVMSVVLLGMLSPMMIGADDDKLRELASAPAIFVGGWGLFTLAGWPMWPRIIAKLQRYVGLDAAALRAIWSTGGGDRVRAKSDD
jgi:hypothetical protein